MRWRAIGEGIYKVAKSVYFGTPCSVFWVLILAHQTGIPDSTKLDPTDGRPEHSEESTLQAYLYWIGQLCNANSHCVRVCMSGTGYMANTLKCNHQKPQQLSCFCFRLASQNSHKACRPSWKLLIMGIAITLLAYSYWQTKGTTLTEGHVSLMWPVQPNDNDGVDW